MRRVKQPNAKAKRTITQNGIMKGIMFERGRKWNYKKELIFIL